MTNWQTKKLGQIAKVQTGPFGAQLHEKDYVEIGGTPIITVENLVDGVVKLLPGTPKVSDEDKRRLSRYILSEGDIVFSRVGAVDRSAYVTGDSDGWMFSGRLLRVHPGEDLDAKYLNYHFSDEHTKNLIRNLAVGGTMPSLNTEILNFVPISYPEKPEQERIVGVLEVWDEYIEKLEQKIALKEQLKKGLMQQLLTGKRRLPGFTEEWEKRRFADIAHVARGKMLTSKSLTQGKYPVVAGGKTSPYSHGDYTHEDVVTVSGSGASAGYVAYHGYKIWASDCSVIEGKNGVSITKYLSLFLKYNQERLYALQSGGAQPHIYPSDIRTLNIELPEISEQESIVKVLRVLDEDIDKLSDKSSSIKLQKKYLLKNLITGIIRTPEDLQPLDTSRLERSAL